EILCLYLAIYNITYVMIDYSFLYRMFLSCYYFWVPMESGRLRLRESTMRDFGLLHLCGVAFLISIIAICIAFMAYAFFEITYYLKYSKLISKTSVRLQRQLLITLCLQ
ncbi:hypothetical protein PMAYCL1PPCAC_15182, partial [Pristionchus mayeri]